MVACSHCSKQSMELFYITKGVNMHHRICLECSKGPDFIYNDGALIYKNQKTRVGNNPIVNKDKTMNKKCFHCSKNISDHYTTYSIVSGLGEGHSICQACMFLDVFDLFEDDTVEYNNRELQMSKSEDDRMPCHRCEEHFDIDEMREQNDKLYCEDCYVDLFSECEHCDSIVDSSDIYSVNNDRSNVCTDCLHDRYTYVECCSVYVPNEYAHYVRTYDHYECDNCYDSSDICEHTSYGNNRGFKSKNHDPDHRPHMGIEIEFELEGACPEEVHDIVFDNLSNVDLKEDTSMDNGMELVSCPMTLDYFNDEVEKWNSILSSLEIEGCRSGERDRADNAGIHVHVERRYLSEDAVDRMILFFSAHQANIEDLAGRCDNEYSVFPKLDMSSQFNMGRSITHHRNTAGRYYAVNTKNSETIEIRVFDGTLDIASIKLNLQFVNAMYTFCKLNESIDTILDWQAFIASADRDFKELNQYFWINHVA